MSGKKKNAGFSFTPGFLRPKQRRARGAQPYNRRVAAMVRKRLGEKAPSARALGALSELRSALKNLGYTAPQAKQMARSARGSDFDSQLRDALSKRNPMATKKKKKKKKNGKMPAGLRRYWAKMKRLANPKKRKKRNKKRPRRKPVKRNPIQRRRRPRKKTPRRRIRGPVTFPV